MVAILALSHFCSETVTSLQGKFHGNHSPDCQVELVCRDPHGYLESLEAWAEPEMGCRDGKLIPSSMDPVNMKHDLNGLSEGFPQMLFKNQKYIPATTSHSVHLRLAKCQVWRKQSGHEASHVLSNPDLGKMWYQVCWKT